MRCERTGSVVRLFSMRLGLQPLQLVGFMRQAAVRGSGKTKGERYAGLDSRDDTKPESASAWASAVSA